MKNSSDHIFRSDQVCRFVCSMLMGNCEYPRIMLQHIEEITNPHELTCHELEIQWVNQKQKLLLKKVKYL